mgnify:CR=1 FL=1
MSYNTILAAALEQAQGLPRKPVVKPKPKPVIIEPPKPSTEDLLAQIKQIVEALPKQDNSYLLELISKLEFQFPQPVVNVAAPDISVIADAMQSHADQLSKLARLMNTKSAVTATIYRDEDGKMSQILIERE